MQPVPLSFVLVSAVGVQVLCQVFKVFYYSAKIRKLDARYFVSAGGMPSSHSAFVTALTVAIGLVRGVRSELFAVAFVFSVVVMYDAFRLRGTVERHSKVLAKLSNLLPETERVDIPQMVGHSLGEIAVGMAVGGGLCVLLFLTAGAF